MSRAVTRVATTGLALVAMSGATLLTALLTAGPAYAADYPIGPSEGEDRGPSLGTLTTLALYVGLPLLSAGLIFAITWLPGALSANRYRPAKGWGAEPVWFAGPPEPVAAVQSAEVGDVVRGGARGSW